MTTEEYIKRFQDIHGTQYDYSKVVFKNCKTKVVIGCRIHGEFQQNIHKHLIGRGCPTCGLRKCAEGISLSFETFENRAREKYGDKFEYFKDTYVNLSEKMTLRCPEHGIINMTPQSHIICKTGCKACGISDFIKKKTYTHHEFIELAKQKHGELYDYTKTIYTKGSELIIVICKTHGEFQQMAKKHLMGGCRKCADELHASQKRKPIEKYVEEAKAIWGDIYDYSQVQYTSSISKITIICSKHGQFQKIASDHLAGQGCIKCKPKKHSKLATLWLEYMSVRDKVIIQHANNGGEHRVKNTLYHSDGFCENTNTLYEFHGTYWHGDPRRYKADEMNKQMNKPFGELYKNTLKKIQICKEQGYNVIECWEADWKTGIKAVKKLQKAFRIWRKKSKRDKI
jgi:G:T-mismatch repair DNA endonuclease (very short patch repair protein)